MSNHVPSPLIGFRVWTVKLWEKRPALFSRYGYSEIPWKIGVTNHATCREPIHDNQAYNKPYVRPKPQVTMFWIVNRQGERVMSAPHGLEDLINFRKGQVDPAGFRLINLPYIENEEILDELARQVEADRLEQEAYEMLVPHEDRYHRCGFNAYYNLDDAVQNELYRMGIIGKGKDPGVVGMIAGSGKVIEHDYGFRAGKAQILALIDTHQNSLKWRPKQLGKWLNIPVIKPEAIGWFGNLHGECRFEQNLTAGR